MNIDAKKSLQDDAHVFQAGEAEKGRKFAEGQQAAKFAHDKDMQTADHQFKAGEAEKGREFTAGQNKLTREHEKGLANERNDVIRQGQILDHIYRQGSLGLEREKFNLSKEELAWKKSLEADKKNGFTWEISDDGYLYARYGEGKNPTAYRTSISGPKIPAGMSEEAYFAKVREAQRYGVVAGTVPKKDGSHVVAYQLPGGGLTENLQEAILAHKGGAK